VQVSCTCTLNVVVEKKMKNCEVAVELCFHVRETMCAVVPFLEKGQVLFMKQITQ